MNSLFYTTAHRYSKDGGYSLVETVIYMALFVTLSTVLIGSLFGMMTAYTEVRATDDLLQSAEVSLGRMELEVRNAVALDSASTFGANPGTLVLDAVDGSGSPKTVTFSLSGTTLQMVDSTDGSTRDLTGSKIQVTSLIFRNISTTAGSAVRIEMTLKASRSKIGRTIVLGDTAALRGDY